MPSQPSKLPSSSHACCLIIRWCFAEELASQQKVIRRDRGGRGPAPMDVRCAPKADRRELTAICLLRANSDRTHLQQTNSSYSITVDGCDRCFRRSSCVGIKM